MSEPTPEQQLDYVAGQSQLNLTPVAIAAGLGGAFLAYRAYMKRELTGQLRGLQEEELTPEELYSRTRQTFESFKLKWNQVLVPLLMAGYQMGQADTEYTISHMLLEEMAYRYAEELGTHINEVSAESIVRGYTAQVNRGLAPRKAVVNVIEAFGVPSSRMRSLVGVWTAAKQKVESEVPQKRSDRDKQIIAAALNERAKVMSEQESWNAREQAKSIIWMYAQRENLIPPTATRQWITAADELVCQYCGPMHKVQMSVGDRFDVPGFGLVWTPPIHPRCRCKVVLRLSPALNVGTQLRNVTRRRWLVESTESIEPEVFEKAATEVWDERKVKRDAAGKFATKARRKTLAAPAGLTAPTPLTTPGLAVPQGLTAPKALSTPALATPALAVPSTKAATSLTPLATIAATPLVANTRTEARALQARVTARAQALQTLPEQDLPEGTRRLEQPLFGVWNRVDSMGSGRFQVREQELTGDRQELGEMIEREVERIDSNFVQKKTDYYSGTAPYEMSNGTVAHVPQHVLREVVGIYRNNQQRTGHEITLVSPENTTATAYIGTETIAQWFGVEFHTTTKRVDVVQIQVIPEDNLTTDKATGDFIAKVNGMYEIDPDMDPTVLPTGDADVVVLKPSWKYEGPKGGWRNSMNPPE